MWFKNSKPISKPLIVVLGNGDVYIMSEKAAGNDWMCKNIATLRHAAAGDSNSKYFKTKE
tara:strand:- start:312 stop:491 length:180 start_codon:yes stop_codon:yes gene_type:complete